MPSAKQARTLLIAISLLIVPSLTSAENRKSSIEFAGLWSFIRYDSNAGLDADFAPTAQLGFHFTKRHAAELSLTTTTSSAEQGGFNVDVDILRAGYTYNAYPRERVVSFFRSGIGMMALHPEDDPDPSVRLESPDHQIMVYGGAGVRFFFNDTIALRLDGTIDFIDGPDGFAHADIQATGSVGVAFVLGGTDESPSTP
jgi:hypothetical protein